MNHEEIISKFYTSFANGDHKGMASCYHQDIVFEDPAFGKMTGDRVSKMWEMLLSNKTATPKINFSNIQTDGEKGSANWIAEYVYGPQKRKVVNHIHANFTFKEGQIIEHTDSFNLWKWSSQALGSIGYFLGWSPFLKKKIQTFANKRLDDFIKKQTS